MEKIFPKNQIFPRMSKTIIKTLNFPKPNPTKSKNLWIFQETESIQWILMDMKIPSTRTIRIKKRDLKIYLPLKKTVNRKVLLKWLVWLTLRILIMMPEKILIMLVTIRDKFKIKCPELIKENFPNKKIFLIQEIDQSKVIRVEN